jgi:hypothetical protein
MKEDKKIGYSALIIGAICLAEAWVNILSGDADTLEVFFLGIGLVASLAGIALIISKSAPVVKE